MNDKNNLASADMSRILAPSPAGTPVNPTIRQIPTTREVDYQEASRRLTEPPRSNCDRGKPIDEHARKS